MLTCKAVAGTENIMASLKIGFFSSLFVEVFFLLTFFPFCSKYTLTKQSETMRVIIIVTTELQPTMGIHKVHFV